MAKRAASLTSEFCRTANPTSLLIKRRFSQISIIFGSVAGGKTLPRPHSTYFSSKKSSLARRSCITLPLNGARGYGVSMNTIPWRDVLRRCRRTGYWRYVTASKCLSSLVWESTTSENGLISRFSSADAWREYYNHHTSWRTIKTCSMTSKVGCKAFAG